MSSFRAIRCRTGWSASSCPRIRPTGCGGWSDAEADRYAVDHELGGERGEDDSEQAGDHRFHLVAEEAHQRPRHQQRDHRSEEHTSELQSLMRISYAVFCLKKKKDELEQNRHNRYNNTK